MAKNKENLIDVCIRILRNLTASEESKDLAEVVLRSELDKPTQRVVEHVYIDRYRRRPWYDDYCLWSASATKSGAVGQKFAASLQAKAPHDADLTLLASALAGRAS